MMLPPVPPALAPKSLVLSEARSHVRPLLIFAPSSNNPRLVTQCRMLAGQGFAERDVVIAMPPSLVSTGPCQALKPATLSAAEAASARRRFHIDPTKFTIVLVGKDGGEKFTSTSPVEAQRLFDTIDAMPMRQEEMAHPRKPETP